MIEIFTTKTTLQDIVDLRTRKLFQRLLCNYCICMEDGVTTACTSMACDKDIYNKVGTLKKPIKI